MKDTRSNIIKMESIRKVDKLSRILGFKKNDDDVPYEDDMLGKPQIPHPTYVPEKAIENYMNTSASSKSGKSSNG